MRNLLIYLTIFSLFVFSAPSEANMFGYSRIDFFNEIDDENLETDDLGNQGNQEDKEISENMWIEPTIGPNGNIQYYQPPKVVLDFLTEPTRYNAEAYFDWNSKRLEQITKAQQLLNQITYERKMLGDFRPNQDLPRRIRQEQRAGEPYVAFFLLKGCLYCEKQKKIIASFKKNHPSTKTDVFVKGYEPIDIDLLPFKAEMGKGLSRDLGISAYPTTLIINTNGTQNIIPGIVREDIINQYL